MILLKIDLNTPEKIVTIYDNLITNGLSNISFSFKYDKIDQFLNVFTNSQQPKMSENEIYNLFSLFIKDNNLPIQFYKTSDDKRFFIYPFNPNINKPREIIAETNIMKNFSIINFQQTRFNASDRVNFPNLPFHIDNISITTILRNSNINDYSNIYKYLFDNVLIKHKVNYVQAGKIYGDVLDITVAKYMIDISHLNIINFMYAIKEDFETNDDRQMLYFDRIVRSEK